jgi:hypothetical protein
MLLSCMMRVRYPNQDGLLLYAALNGLVNAVDVQVEGWLIEWQLYTCHNCHVIPLP